MASNQTYGTTIEKLKAGNIHYTKHVLLQPSESNIDKVKHLAEHGQAPTAVIVTCSDARVSPERLFNVELGELFVIRTAGNVVDSLELGSVEYAASHIKSVDTIIVLGHDHCGAVHSTYHYHGEDIGNIKSIVDKVIPSMEKAKKETDDEELIIKKTEDYNIINSVNEIKNSKIIKGLIEQKKVTVAGAKYCIFTGEVTFFE